MTRGVNSDRTKDVPSAFANLLKNRWKSMLPLLKAEPPIAFDDFETIDTSLWREMSRRGIIKHADGYTPKNRVWEIEEQALERLKQYQSLETEYPPGTKVCPYCGHRGFKNLVDAGYQCSDPRCEREFAEFAEVGSA